MGDDYICDANCEPDNSPIKCAYDSDCDADNSPVKVYSGDAAPDDSTGSNLTYVFKDYNLFAKAGWIEINKFTDNVKTYNVVISHQTIRIVRTDGKGLMIDVTDLSSIPIGN